MPSGLQIFNEHQVPIFDTNDLTFKIGGQLTLVGNGGTVDFILPVGARVVQMCFPANSTASFHNQPIFIFESDSTWTWFLESPQSNSPSFLVVWGWF